MPYTLLEQISRDIGIQTLGTIFWKEAKNDKNGDLTRLFANCKMGVDKVK